MKAKAPEILLTCPDCGAHGFLPRGLTAHRGTLNCQRRITEREEAVVAANQAEVAARAAVARTPHPSTPSRMAKPNTISALSIVGSAELKADTEQLSLLQASAVEQFRRMRAMREEEALRGVLLGLTLHRVKASLPHGEFGKWAKMHATFGERWVNYLMKLALIFIDKSKATKPELLACPGDQIALAIDGMEGEQRRFVTKAKKFVGELSLAELLDKYEIKTGKKLGGAREKGEEEQTPPTPEELAQQTRDEIGTGIQKLEQLLITENRLQYVVGETDFLRGTVESLETLHAKTAALVAKLTKTAKPVKPV